MRLFNKLDARGFHAYFLALTLLSASPSSFALDESTKKTLHFGLSAGMAFAGESFIAAKYPDLSPVVGGVVIALLPGVLKEVVDRHGGESTASNIHDLKLDLAGAVSGALLSNYIRKETGWSLFVSHRQPGYQIVMAKSF